MAGALVLLVLSFFGWLLFSGPASPPTGGDNASAMTWGTKVALAILVGLAVGRILPMTRDHLKVPGTTAIVLLLAWGVWQLWAIAVLGDKGPAVQEKLQGRMAQAASSAFSGSSAPAASDQRSAPGGNILTGQYVWKEYNEDGSLPKGEWSEWKQGAPGCKFKQSVDHSTFKVQYLKDGKVADFTPGAKPGAQAWRVAPKSDSVGRERAPTWRIECAN